LIGYVPIENAFSERLATLGSVAPQQLVQLLRDQLREIADGNQGWPSSTL
jgi:hypothetical protein